MKEKIEFLRSFLKVLNAAKFDVTGVQLMEAALTIQKYARVVAEIEKEFEELNKPKEKKK